MKRIESIYFGSNKISHALSEINLNDIGGTIPVVGIEVQYDMNEKNSSRLLNKYLFSDQKIRLHNSEMGVFLYFEKKKLTRNIYKK
jgi:hypothetical protein